METLHLERDDSSSIGFVLACLFSQALTKDELRTWTDTVLMEHSPFPSYIYELSTFDGHLKDITQVIGFSPESGLRARARITSGFHVG